MIRLIATCCLFILPAIAFAHPHDAPKTPDEPDHSPKIIIKKMMKKGDSVEAHNDIAKKVIKKRVMISKDGVHRTEIESDGDKKHHKIIGLSKNSKLIDLGDDMVAKIDGDEVMILVDGAPLGLDPRGDETIKVEKEIKIEDGRKKTRITIELDAPAQ